MVVIAGSVLPEMENITGKATQLVDLEGKFMFPGFIDAHRSPVLKVFQDQYLDLSDCRSAEEILSAVSAWAEEHEDQEILFGYGYRDDLKPQEPNAGADAEDDAEDLVVTRSGHEPLVVMLKSDYDAWRETEYLSRGAHGRELRRRAAEMEAGERVGHELIDPDAEASA